MKKLLSFTMLLFCVTCIFAQNNQNNAQTSIAMLNYLGTQTVMIEQSKNNRLLLEQISNNFFHNINVRGIDTRTQSYFNSLLDNIDGLRLINIQREKVQFIHESQKAQTISQALPNPLYLLAIKDKNPLEIIMTATMMTADSAVRYNSAKSNADVNLILANFDIQKDELVTLSGFKKDYFNYVIDITRKNNFDGSESLSQESIERFVEYVLDSSRERAKEWFEQNQNLYAKYAPYWLALANVYYELKQYDECLKAVQTYESVQAPIFRKDFDLARIIPKAIISASNLYGDNALYISFAVQYLQKLRENTDERDWDIKYFAAQTYINLASLGNRQTNLASAYDILVENIIYLSREQDGARRAYINEIQMPSDIVGDQKKRAEKLVSELKKARKTELPPMHAGLALNYQTIFPLMDELNKTQADRMRVSDILKKTTVMPEFGHKYFGDAYNYTAKNFIINRNITGARDVVNGVISIVGNSVNWNKFSVELPAIFLSENSTIDVSIRDGRLHTFPAVPFTVQNVDRKKSVIASDYVAKIEIPLKDTITLEKDKGYILSITIKTYDMSCSIFFTCPNGKTSFEYSRIE